ncbi:MAG: hypothetical protein V4649_19600 [Bacteroidota bacterium]
MRDTRNGNEYEYESNLANSKHIVSFVGVEHTKRTENAAAKEEARVAAEQAAEQERLRKLEADAADKPVEPARSEVVAAVEAVREDSTKPAVPTPPAVPKPPVKPVVASKSVARKAPARKAPTRR